MGWVGVIEGPTRLQGRQVGRAAEPPGAHLEAQHLHGILERLGAEGAGGFGFGGGVVFVFVRLLLLFFLVGGGGRLCGVCLFFWGGG